jgi:hypothetical protein
MPKLPIGAVHHALDHLADLRSRREMSRSTASLTNSTRVTPSFNREPIRSLAIAASDAGAIMKRFEAVEAEAERIHAERPP